MEQRLISIVRKFLDENNHFIFDQHLSLSLSISRHLGFDSIGRAELFNRIEKEFNVLLSDKVMREAETLQDIAIALRSSDTVFSYKTVIPERSVLTGTQDLSHLQTLVELLIFHASDHPNAPHIYIQAENQCENIITFHDLLLNSKKIALNLIQQGLQKSDTVAIMLPTSSHFFYSFMGVLLAGGIPVPIYPPARMNQLENYIKKESHILSNSAVRYLITIDKAKWLSHLFKSFVPTLNAVLTMDTLLKDNNAEILPSNPNINDIALIQYTSGSTSHPKGVVLTHHNILSNIRAYGRAINITASDICVSWLPLYHDLGLIGNWLGSLYFKVPLIVFSPIDFLNRPARWLWAIHHHRGTISAAPNFAYELCINKLQPHQLEGLDLSSWRIAINGAEIIRPETLKRFYQKFSHYGLKQDALLPVYGLAENSLGLTATPLNRGVRIDKIDRLMFESMQQAIPLETGQYLEFVSCGKVLQDHKIRIVNAKGHVLPERFIGHIQFQGPSSMKGYLNNYEASLAIYQDGWWNTGDLGYLADEEIFITGRKKDIIIKAGRNYVPTDIENMATQVPGIRPGCVIAFSVNNKEKKTEELIVVAETTEKNKMPLMNAINIKMNEYLNISADQIILVPPKTLPKTSSGKLQRAECKKMYLENKLMKKASPLSIQILKLFWRAFLTKASNYSIFLGKIFYTLYAFVWVIMTFPVIYLLILVTSNTTSRLLISHWFKYLFFVNFVPIKVEGTQNLSRCARTIFISNHCSYMDIVFLLAILPKNICLVGKKSLLKVPILKTFIKKLNYVSIDKHDSVNALDDIKCIKKHLMAKESVLLFPESTFGYAKGLRPFKLGSFKIAIDTQISITPITIHGTRHLLQGNSWLFKWSPLKAIISEPLLPQGAEWKDMIDLKNRAYSVILKNCDEPGLDSLIGNSSASKKEFVILQQKNALKI